MRLKKVCPQCSAVLHARKLACQCGHVFPAKPQQNERKRPIESRQTDNVMNPSLKHPLLVYSHLTNSSPALTVKRPLNQQTMYLARVLHAIPPRNFRILRFQQRSSFNLLRINHQYLSELTLELCKPLLARTQLLRSQVKMSCSLLVST